MADKDFASALQGSQSRPDLPDELAAKMPDLLAGTSGHPLFSTVDSPSDGVPGATSLNMEFNCARLVVGPVESGRSAMGGTEYDDYDDTARLKEIMDKCLSGKGVRLSKSENFLKSGAVVVWIEWMEYKEPSPKKERAYMTFDEVMSPTPSDELEDAEEDDDDADSI